MGSTGAALGGLGAGAPGLPRFTLSSKVDFALTSLVIDNSYFYILSISICIFFFFSYNDINSSSPPLGPISTATDAFYKLSFLTLNGNGELEVGPLLSFLAGLGSDESLYLFI